MVIPPHFASVALVLMFKDRHDFLLNKVYILLGTFNAALHVFCRRLLPLSRIGLAYIILASVSTAGYAIAAFHSHWKVRVNVSRRNKSPRLAPLSPEPESLPDPPPIPQLQPRPYQHPQQQQWSRYFPNPSAQTSELTDETDRQLLRLLHTNTGNVPNRQLVRDTFRIELPEEDQNRNAVVPAGGSSAGSPETAATASNAERA
ncbi:hypothetical protein T310_1830 [Rasamsonia emersonii CBS 393.64]|uniref:Uncharacterized protein n=1 Tax=Rasamsonia emersonii (strain ATCC 16479 / CBS 393.64 / IMI 116815) TaxID=1408163 RepID=A0A0F4Z2T0_RASE3|nr:hypothetical protein T310_1830 [Rasamsonia emersonii CBS 393.64]KKA24178.1 hypothetical protein T310_1830 [Rasamsonia emersonii CBS 393.64]